MRWLGPALVVVGSAACVAACVIRVRLSDADGSLRHALASLLGHRAEIARWHGWALSCLVTGTALVAFGALVWALTPARVTEDAEKEPAKRKPAGRARGR